MNFEILQSLPEQLQENYTLYCMMVETDINIDRVILNDENRSKIEEFIMETQYKEKFMQYGLKPINRLILYGASGTGKTYLTKALSNYLGYELLYIDIANSLQANKAAQAIDAIFDLGNHIGKAVIFLDECDAICWARDDADNKDDAAIRRANNSLFQHLDQMNPACVFVSATNLYKNLDTAFVNRFNIRMKFDRPLVDNLDEDFKKILLPAFTIDYDFPMELKEVIWFYARTFDQMSYRAMTDWVERAEKNSLIRDTTVVSESEIYGYLMEAMRVKIDFSGDKPRLYKEGG